MRRTLARRRGWRTGAIEALEGRALLATTLYDPSFGSGGLAVGAVNTSSETSAVTAVAVQGDGKVVTAEVNTPNGATNAAPTTTPLVVRRFNADGSIDTAFGTNGTTIIPISTEGTIVRAPHDIAITATGQILVAFEESITITDPASGVSQTVQHSMVARLTSAGALDTTFGTGGESVVLGSVADVDSVVVESSGRVVVAGVKPFTRTTNAASFIGVVVGLTSAGALDTSFGTEGMVSITATSLFGASYSASEINTQVAGLRFTPTGQLLLGVAQSGLAGGVNFVAGTTLSRLSADGTLDTSFGTGGTVDLSPDYPTDNIFANDMVIQTDGRVVLAGVDAYKAGESGFLIRLHADGTVDPTFPEVLTPTPYYYVFNSFQSVAVGFDGAITAVSGGIVPTSYMQFKTGQVYRFLADGTPDPNFGTGGVADITAPSSVVPTGTTSFNQLNGPVALTSDGEILVGGSISGTPTFSQTFLTQILSANPLTTTPSKSKAANDYNGDGRSDLAAELTQFGAFADRTTTGDVVQPFGPVGVNQAIPAPGDYDGDGKTDVAAYLPAYGVLAYRPSHGGADVYIRFGPVGQGAAIPVPGDYDGDGKTDFALLAPGGLFVIDPSSGAAPYSAQFDNAGLGGAIPAPGDYDGDGKTDLAVYLPILGAFSYRASSAPASTPDVYVPFGPKAIGGTLPAPGDYDGDGKTDIAAFLPEYGVFVYRASSGTGDVLTPFGPTGQGNAIPVPGDYDGDGKTDVALYLPNSATYAIDPSGGGAPYAQQFGQPGAGKTVPATAVVLGQNTVSAQSFPAADAPPGVLVYLPDDLIADLSGTATRTKKPLT